MKSQGLWLATALSCGACGEGQEPARVALPVLVDSSGMTPMETNLGYAVALSQVRVVVEDLEFTIGGEAQTASFWQRLSELAVPSAHAHPGHYQGGDVTGELPGHFVASWLPATSAPLGVANLIIGAYESANFTFGGGVVGDAVGVEDALIGHTALLLGEATRSGLTIAFEAVIDAPQGRQLVGAPFRVEIQESGQVSLGLQLLTVDPVEGDTLFDDLDFEALPREPGLTLRLGPSSSDPALVDAYNSLKRAFQTHDHFTVVVHDSN